MYIEQLLNKLRVAAIPVEDFELAPDAARSLRHTNFHEGVQHVQKKQKSDPIFAENHAAAYAMRGFRWPPTQNEIKVLGDLVAALNQRPSEVALYISRVFKWTFDPTATENRTNVTLKKVQYVDLNCSLERLCGNSFEKDPWASEIMTLTCKAIILQRTSTWDSETTEVKCVFKVFDGLELMQLQGFDKSYFHDGGGYIPEHEQGTHMAGNMFNAFMIAAFLVATIAADGAKEPESSEGQKQDAVGEEEEGNNDSARSYSYTDDDN